MLMQILQHNAILVHTLTQKSCTCTSTCQDQFLNVAQVHCTIFEVLFAGTLKGSVE